MKALYKLLGLWMLLISIYIGCKKDQSTLQSTDFRDEQFIADAKSYINMTELGRSSNSTENGNTESNDAGRSLFSPIKTMLKSIDWNKAYVTNYSIGQVVIAPVNYYTDYTIKTNISGKDSIELDKISKLILFKDLNSQFHVRLVTFLPDSNFLRGNSIFTGIATVQNWQGDYMRRLLFTSEGIKQLVPTDSLQDGTVTTDASGTRANLAQVVQTCFTAMYYNYSVDDPLHGYSYSESQCFYQFVASDGTTSNDPAGTDLGTTGGTITGNASVTTIAVPTGAWSLGITNGKICGQSYNWGDIGEAGWQTEFHGLGFALVGPQGQLEDFEYPIICVQLSKNNVFTKQQASQAWNAVWNQAVDNVLKNANLYSNKRSPIVVNADFKNYLKSYLLVNFGASASFNTIGCAGAHTVSTPVWCGM